MKQLVLKAAKILGIIVVFLSVIYTSFQIFDYIQSKKQKIYSQYSYVDFDAPFNGFPVGSFTDLCFKYNKLTMPAAILDSQKINVLNRYLKKPIKSNTELDGLISALTLPSDPINISTDTFLNSFRISHGILTILVTNKSDIEMHDLKIDLPSYYSYNNYFVYTVSNLDPYSGFRRDLNYITNDAISKIISVKTILPKQTLVFSIFGLTPFLNTSNPAPRIIFKDGYEGSSPLLTMSYDNNFDRWVTDKLISSHVLQLLVWAFFLLGIFFSISWCIKLFRKK